MIAPELLSQPASDFDAIVEMLPAGGSLEVRFEGLDRNGDDTSQTALLTLGQGANISLRFATAGLGLFQAGDAYQVSYVTPGGEAARYGLEVGMRVAEVFVANPDRPPKELFFIPALMLIGGVYGLQRRRRAAAEL